MILIADSGSTKTGWATIDKDRKFIFDGTGLHPAFHTDDSFLAGIRAILPEGFIAGGVSHLYFFGSGCLHAKPAGRVQVLLEQVFPKAQVQVRSDLAGAAIATLGKHPGVIAILGTGSSAASWNGRELADVSPSLGYILGDEGSGADLGKALLSAVLYDQLSQELLEAFKQYDPRPSAEIIREIYASAHPGSYLASFVPFIAGHIHQPQIRTLAVKRFEIFLKQHISPLTQSNTEVHFCGGVASQFSDIIAESCQLMGLKAGKIVKSPLDGLINFYCSGHTLGG